MNQYQKVILSTLKISINVPDAKVTLNDESLTIKQSENAYIEKYEIIFECLNIDSIEIDNKKIINKDNKILLNVDFSSKINKITLNFVNGIADPLQISIFYVETSKEAWDEKTKKELWAKLKQNAEIKVSTGTDLVNIYFQPCTTDYGKTIIELYTANGKWEQPPRVMPKGMAFKSSLLSATIGQLIAKFTIEDGMYFKSITGLARGAYGYRLSQYNSKGELLFTTDYAYFAI